MFLSYRPSDNAIEIYLFLISQQGTQKNHDLNETVSLGTTANVQMDG